MTNYEAGFKSIFEKLNERKESLKEDLKSCVMREMNNKNSTQYFSYI